MSMNSTYYFFINLIHVVLAVLILRVVLRWPQNRGKVSLSISIGLYVIVAGIQLLRMLVLMMSSWFDLGTRIPNLFFNAAYRITPILTIMELVFLLAFANIMKTEIRIWLSKAGSPVPQVNLNDSKPKPPPKRSFGPQ